MDHSESPDASLKDPIIYSSATALAGAIKRKEISSEEITRKYLDRIEEVNPTINAVIRLLPNQALEAAIQADKALAAGNAAGPLHGVPMTIKDSFDTRGVVTTAGTLGRAAYVPAEDATVVRRLREAGAILLGKTNTPELTLAGDTYNLLFGQTNNPYRPDHSPGGSSGGAAAIVSAGGAAFDVGTDTGGSIRNPAHSCGLCGLKPTSGRVSRAGHIISFHDYRESLTTAGPITRYVEDLITIWPLLSGSDGIDPYIQDIAPGDPRSVMVSGLKYAFYTDNGIASPEAEVVEMIQQVAAALSNTGAAVEENRPGAVPRTVEMFLEIFNADGGHTVRKILADSGTTRVASYLQWALEDTGGDKKSGNSRERFAEVFEHWGLFRSEMASFFTKYDIILCPVSSREAFPQGLGVDELRHHSLSYTATYNLTGWPVAVVRAGTSASGLPLGIQIAGKPWCEHKVLAVAEFIERTFGGFKVPGI